MTYDTPHGKLQAIADAIGKLIATHNNVRFERCHLARLTATAIEFEIVYFVLSSNYVVYMDVVQSVNLGIVDYFEREQIRFAATGPQWVLRESA